jgi:hypothetical protein
MVQDDRHSLYMGLQALNFNMRCLAVTSARPSKCQMRSLHHACGLIAQDDHLVLRVPCKPGFAQTLGLSVPDSLDPIKFFKGPFARRGWQRRLAEVTFCSLMRSLVVHRCSQSQASSPFLPQMIAAKDLSEIDVTNDGAGATWPCLCSFCHSVYALLFCPTAMGAQVLLRRASFNSSSNGTDPQLRIKLSSLDPGPAETDWEPCVMWQALALLCPTRHKVPIGGG